MKIDMRRYAAATDPDQLRELLLEDLAPTIAGIDLIANRVLVATYVRPERTAGGIILADRTLDEDKWQGKAGLIIANGPLAFQFEEGEHAFVGGRPPQPGDWVFYRGSDAWDLALAPGVHCRCIFDEHVIGKFADPRVIY